VVRYVLFVTADNARASLSGGLSSYLTASDWDALRSLGARCCFNAGDRLFRQGDEGESVYVILAGAAKVVRSESAGKSAILTIRAAGDVVGDMAAIDGGRRSAAVTALTPLVCRVLTGSAFRRFIGQPAVAAGFARYTVSRLREADLQRAELAVLPVRQRLARALLRLDEAAGNARRRRAFELPQQDLAELIGASRNAIVLALGLLRAEGVIDTRRRRVAVMDPGALHRIAHGIHDAC
jgi:CRP-like cAMP-binding protein